MTGRLTFTIIKPVAVAERQEGKIIDAILKKGFNIVALKRHQLTQEEAEDFYTVHKDKYFFTDLVTFMTSSPVYLGVLEKEDCVAQFRKIIGETDPRKAASGTIRKRFGKSLRSNAVHGSDSDENAAREIALFFPEVL